MEEHLFLGDTIFWTKVNQLAICRPQLVDITDELLLPERLNRQKITITAAGEDLLCGKLNLLNISYFNRWLGGVFINEELPFVFSRRQNTLVPR
jgi:hypothetical protein